MRCDMRVSYSGVKSEIVWCLSVHEMNEAERERIESRQNRSSFVLSNNKRENTLQARKQGSKAGRKRVYSARVVSYVMHSSLVVGHSFTARPFYVFKRDMPQYIHIDKAYITRQNIKKYNIKNEKHQQRFLLAGGHQTTHAAAFIRWNDDALLLSTRQRLRLPTPRCTIRIFSTHIRTGTRRLHWRRLFQVFPS